MDAIRELFRRIGKKDARTLAIVDLGFGDSGKGRYVDWLAEWADIIARGTGGANAGHTIKTGDGQTHIFHLVPSGIMWDSHKKINIIGRGVAVDPRTLIQELMTLDKAGLTYNGLRISHQARLVLPMDIALDQLKEVERGSGAIGTTGRGIGPVYESQVARIGLVINDLLNRDIFVQKLRRNMDTRWSLFRQFDPDLVFETLHQPALGGGSFYGGSVKIFNIDAIVEKYLAYTKKFSQAISRTDLLMQQGVGQRKILLEGAQGVLLSIDYGTYPYVTSSDCSLAGLTKGVDLDIAQVDYTLGVVKAPYMTRVGHGPFPTELGGGDSAQWCSRAGMTRALEKEKYFLASINSANPLEQGIAIRQAGEEYGATTGRLRRVGWLDLPLLRYARKYGGPGQGGLALTKPDVMNGCQTIKVCIRYRYEGEHYWVGDTLLAPGAFLDTAIMDSYVLEHCLPLYQELPGWSDLRSPEDALAGLIEIIETYCNTTVDVVSIGAERDALVVL